MTATVPEVFGGRGPRASELATWRTVIRQLSNKELVQKAPAMNITSTSYGDIGAGGTLVSLTFTKITADSALEVHIEGSGFLVATAPVNMEFGVRINGVDYSVGVYRFNAISDHRTFAGTARIPAGLAATAYTVTARAKLDTAARTVQSDSFSTTTMTVQEVPA